MFLETLVVILMKNYFIQIYGCCLCILTVVHVFLSFVHVFLTLSTYSYCCLCILIAVYVFLDAATLT